MTDRTMILGQLYQFINEGDDRLLKLMFALATAYQEEERKKYTFTEEEIAVFEANKKRRLRGESSSFQMEESTQQ